MSTLAFQRSERRNRLLATGVLAALIPFVAAFAATRPHAARWVFAICLLALTIVLVRRWPRTTAVGLLCALPFLALLRRVLLSVAPWSSYDPLVLLGPVAAALLLSRFVATPGERATSRSRLPTAVAIVAIMALVEVANPSGGGVKAGAVGLLFIVGPLLWFFVGLDLGDELAVGRVIRGTIGVAVVVALYGLGQTALGFPSWDHHWLDWLRQSQGNIGALQVSNSIRPFASFSSFAEYCTYLSAGVVFCVALALRGRRAAVLALVVLLPALFFASARGPFVLAIIGSLVLIVASIRRPRSAALVVAFTLVVLVGGSAALSSAGGSSSDSAASGNGLVSHQVSGLSDPFNSQSSTLSLHLAVITAGLRQGFTRPLGSGTAATNLAGAKIGGGASFTSTRQAFARQQGLNNTQNGTEFDISDAFVALGLIGGLAYLLVVLGSFRLLWRLVRRQQSFAWLGGLGLLVVMIGQWLNGGYYALAPLIWFIIGASVRVAAPMPDRFALSSEAEATPALGSFSSVGPVPVRESSAFRDEAMEHLRGRLSRPREELRVIFANHTASMSGGELALLEELAGLRSLVTPIVASPPGAFADAVQAAGYPWRSVPAGDGGMTIRPTAAVRALTRLLAHGRALIEIAAEEGAPLIYANTIRSGLGVSLASRGKTPRLVVAVHDCLPDGPATDFVHRAVNRRADLILANSQYTAHRWARTAGHRPPIRVVYPGFDPARIRTDVGGAETRTRFGLTEESFVLVLLAQITPWKGQETAIHALSQLRQNLRQLHLLIVGEVSFSAGTRFNNAAYVHELQELVMHADMTDAVTFTGHLPSIGGVLSAADVVLQPSWEEPFGRSVVEAMAAGVPVIATSVGGPAEIISDGIDGRLVDPRDPIAWAAAIEALALDPEGTRQMGVAARARAQDFDVSAATREIWTSIAPLLAD